jgi:hypothetical protein
MGIDMVTVTDMETDMDLDMDIDRNDSRTGEMAVMSAE